MAQDPSDTKKSASVTPVFKNTSKGMMPVSTADRIVRAFISGTEDGPQGLDILLGDEVAEGRQDILDMAVRNIVKEYGEEAGVDLAERIMEEAETNSSALASWCELVVIPVISRGGKPPSFKKLTDGLIESGTFRAGVKVSFYSEWFSLSDVHSLDACSARSILDSLVDGGPVIGIPTQSDANLSPEERIALMGVAIHPDGVDIEGVGDSAAHDAALEQEDKMFSAWALSKDLVDLGITAILMPVPPSKIREEVAIFEKISKAHNGAVDVDEIVDFIDMACLEAGNEEVVCTSGSIAGGYEIRLETETGRFLDSRVICIKALPVPPASMPRLLEKFVRFSGSDLSPIDDLRNRWMQNPDDGRTQAEAKSSVTHLRLVPRNSP